MKIYCQYLLFVLGFLMHSLTAFAQDYIFDYQSYGVEDGLLHREVNALYQDSRGFIWLGTKGGLNRFDGYAFKSWTVEKDSFINNDIWQILEDADGFLWLQGILPFQDFDIWNPLSGDRTTFRQKFGEEVFALQPNYFVQSDLDKTIFFSTNNPPGIASFHPKTGLRHFPIEGFQKLKIVAAKENAWCIGDQTSLVEISRDGRIRQQFSHDAPIEISLLANISVPFVYSENIAGVHSKLFYIDERKERVLISDNFPSLLPFLLRLPKSIFAEDLIWNNFELFNLKGQEEYSLDSTIPSHALEGNRSILADKQGDIWSGGNFGVHLIHLQKNRFDTYLTSGRENHHMRGMVVLDNHLYVNDEVNGLYLINTETGQSKSVGMLEEWGHFALSVLDNETIVAGYRSLLFFLKKDGSKKAEEAIRLPERIWSFFRSPDNRLWIGTEQGLYLVDLSTRQLKPYQSYNQFEDLARAHIFHIEADEKGRIWIGTNAGLFQADEKLGIQARYWTGGKGKFHLPHNIIYHFYKEKSQAGKADIFWLASGGGLIRWEPQSGHTVQYTQQDGLSNNIIYAVYGDDYGKLWLSSDYGIMQFDKKTGNSNSFLTKDGISHNEFNRISHYQDETGKIYFGGLNGITAFDPSDFLSPESSSDPPLAITSFQQFDGNKGRLMDKTANILESNEIVLHPDDRFFRLEFALLSFQDADRNQYAYRTEGIDEEWNYQSERTLRFGRLPYGNYTLRVKGQDASGKWSNNELRIPIAVLRPFYLKNWFLVLMAMILLFGGPIYFKSRTKQLKRQKRLLEEEVHRRTDTIFQQKEKLERQAKKLSHLDEVKSRFFANISHELRTPLTLLLGPIGSVLNSNQLDERNGTLLKKAQKSGKDLFRLISEILDLSKMESGRMEIQEKPVLLYPLLRRYFAHFEAHAQLQGVQFLFKYDATEALPILLDTDKFEKVVNNFLSNAFKFTPKGGAVTLRLQEFDSKFLLSVMDTGQGIHPDDVPNVFDRFYQTNRPGAPAEGGTGIGLALIEEYALLFKGKTWVESTLGQGSAFFFEFPKREAAVRLPEVIEGEPAGNKGLSSNLVEGAGGKEGDDSVKNVLASFEKKSTSKSSTQTAEQEQSTLLIVEDNPALRDYLETILSPHYHIVTAENGRAAMELLRPQSAVGSIQQTNCQLIISDLMMPVMDGYQLLEKLKSDEPYCHIPVIILTARADIQDKLRALRIGVDDYILKPFEEEELLVRIANLLDNYRQRSEFASANNPLPSETPEEQAPHTKGDAVWLEQLEALILREVQNDQLSVDWIADLLEVSRRQLLRRLKALTGIVPKQYIQEVRLQEARRLLETQEVKRVKAAAWAVSFRDERYFSKLFRERFGKSPSEFL